MRIGEENRDGLILSKIEDRHALILSTKMRIGDENEMSDS